MANLHLVTGYKGSAHVTSADQGVFNAMSIGAEDYVFTKGRRFEAQIISNNAVRIYDGSLMMNGRQVNLDAGSYLDAIISNGAQGMNRHDIIAIRYDINPTTGIESANLVVEEGTPASGTPTDPTNRYPDSILDGTTVHDMPLYRVVIKGLTITKIEPLFKMLAPMADIQHGFYKQNMLINGDFQCNQRGETTWEVGSDVKYSLDMWRIHQIKMQLHDNGLRVARYSENVQGYLTQFVKVDELAEKYTVALRADGEVYNFTTTVTGEITEKEFDRFKIGIVYVSDTKHIKINFCPLTTAYVTVKYIDLFEGSVAYPHVKEDPATALMRCRRYIQKGCYVSPVWYHSVSSGSNLHTYKYAICHEKLDYTEKTKPTLESHTVGYIDGTGNTVSNAGLPNLTPNSLEGMFIATYQASSKMHDECFAFKGTYVVTCEHNPNGD